MFFTNFIFLKCHFFKVSSVSTLEIKTIWSLLIYLFSSNQFLILFDVFAGGIESSNDLSTTPLCCKAWSFAEVAPIILGVVTAMLSVAFFAGKNCLRSSFISFCSSNFESSTFSVTPVAFNSLFEGLLEVKIFLKVYWKFDYNLLYYIYKYVDNYVKFYHGSL